MGLLDYFKKPAIDEALLEDLLSRIQPPMSEADPAAETPSAASVILSKRFKEYQSAIGKDYQVAAALGAVYMKVISTRKDIIKEVDKIKSFYMTDTLLTQFADDALAPDTITNDVITITSKNKEVDKALKELDSRLKFDALITDNIIDILAYGEYTLGCTVETGKGIVELSDNLDQSRVVSLTRNGEIEGFLEFDQTGRKVTVADPCKYVKFAIPSHKIRMDLSVELDWRGSVKNGKLTDKVPRYVRVGKSMIYPIINKIKELELLEQLIPATNLAKLTSGTLLGVNVPSGLDPEKGMEAARKIEGLINKKVGVNPANGSLTVENILSSAGRLKVIPVFGDKGNITKFDYKQDEPDNLMGSVLDVRKTICSSMGIPYEIVFGGESDDTKGHLLKRYARYLRRLKQIQKCIANGIRQICIIHLVNSNISFTLEDIEIVFRNKLIEIDAIDKLEFLDTSVQMLTNAKQFLLDLMIDPTLGPAVNIGPFLEYVNNQFNTLGIIDVIDMEVANKIKILPTPVEPVVGAEGEEPAATPEESQFIQRQVHRIVTRINEDARGALK